MKHNKNGKGIIFKGYGYFYCILQLLLKPYELEKGAKITCHFSTKANIIFNPIWDKKIILIFPQKAIELLAKR